MLGVIIVITLQLNGVMPPWKEVNGVVEALMGILDTLRHVHRDTDSLAASTYKR
jgi:hypothetical protein